MLSLSPRFDLFRFYIPKDYIPEEILNKFDTILAHNAGVITSAIDYLNESIVEVSIPGMSDLVIEQYQVSHNTVVENSIPALGGRINIEPHHTNQTYSSENPLTKIDREMTITFRQNQGLINYWMLYETMLYRYCKPHLYETSHDQFELHTLSEQGAVVTKLILMQPKITSIDGLEYSYSKMDRQTDTFNVTVVYNDIDIDFVYNQ